MKVECFDGFNIYIEDESHSFIFLDFNDKGKLIDGLTDYLFNENNLLEYASNSIKLHLTETDSRYWATLYRNISCFLNEDLESYEVDEATGELLNVLKEEYQFIDEEGKLLVQKDKVGKIGEYAFHVLMNKYFQLGCIIPKFRCTTDRNMSVFGIDALFLDKEKRRIYFGESKFSKSLSNGIVLANKSLSDYEQQIREEYRLVLSADDAFALSDDFKELFLDETQICISFEKFIKVANITSIGIPVFIAHGKENVNDKPSDYLSMMKNKLKKYKFFGLNIDYIFISLPVIDKTEFVEVAIKKVVKKQHEFESKC